MILMSDCHRGVGNTGDNFLQNQNLFFGALEYYYQNGFTYIELGDGDELWENREQQHIIRAHSDAFWMLSRFYQAGRFYMLLGNHDAVKRRKSYTSKYCDSYYCDSDGCYLPLFPHIRIAEGLILEESKSGERIFLVHGHQGSLLNDTLWPLARFLVRYVWRPLEMVGFVAPTGSARPHHRQDKIEKELAAFAEEQRELLIAGHTHRPVFPSPGEGRYFNDGSCVHPRCITGIEIENNELTMVKWLIACTEGDRHLYVAREVLEGPVPVSAFFFHEETDGAAGPRPVAE